jgi:hypothetical protein
MKLRSLRFASLAFLPLLTLACANEAGEDTDQSEDDLSLPSFVNIKSSELGCGDVASDKFAGFDTAHGYKLDAKKGRSYHFEFAGLLDGNQQTTLALFEATGSKRRVAVARGGERVALDFEPTADTRYVVAAYTGQRAAKGTYKMKQFCAITGQNALTDGQTSFENEEVDQNRFWRMGAQPEASRADSRSAPGGRSQAVEEADVYKVDGTKLFYLNTYRGFLVYDVANPKAPKQMGRLPVYGHPVEMYVQNNVVYALMNDVLELKDIDGRLRFEKKRTAQLVAIDISNPAKPMVLETVDITGSLREGLSRKVGDTIYVVTQDWAYSWMGNEQQSKEQAWVYSFNAANPKDVKLVQKLKIFEGGGMNMNASGVSAGRWFNGVTISATSNALLVAENWQTYSSVWGGPNCGTSQSLQEANVSIVDISNPSGQIKVHTKLTTYGQVGDQFKQTYVQDPATGKATYYGVFARQEWNSNNCTGNSFVQNQLESWDVTNGAAPKQIGKLAFGKPNETVRGTAFDVERGTLFAITAERVDPLYAIDIKNPASLKVLSEVDGLSGDMNLFRFIGDKKFLLAIGTDNSNECQGFNSAATGWTSKVQASIIDVQDTSKIKLVQRKCITVNDAQWMGSEVNWNLDQAHKMIGLHESGLVNLVSVPVYYTKKIPATNGGWDTYKSETAVGLLSWNLQNYDPTKQPAQQNVLDNASTVVHPGGSVKRTVVFTHPGTGQARRKLLNLSNTHLGIVDIENPKAPSTDSVTELAPYKDRVISFGGHVVEQIQPYSDWGWMENGQTEFRVKVMGDNVDDAPAVATFTAPSVERAVKFGDKALVLFSRKTTVTAGNYQTELHATVYDMSTPASPRKAGTVKLPVEYISYPRFAAGSSSYFFPYWGDAQDMVESDKGLVFLTSTWTQSGTQQRKLVGLNLSNLDAPKVASIQLTSDKDTTMLGLAKEETDQGAPASFYLASKKTVGTINRDGTDFNKVQFTAKKYSWNTSNNIVGGSAVNVPGKIVRSFVQDGKRVFLTHDRAFDVLKSGEFAESPRMELLTVNAQGTQASLEDQSTLWGMNLTDLVLDDGRLYTNLSERQRWGGIMPFDVARGPFSWTPPASELRIFEVSSSKIAQRFAEDLGTDGIELMGVHDKRLFVNLAGDGVMIVDARNAQYPTARNFVRTLGWAWSAEVAGSDALIPAGHYGIYQLDLYAQNTLGKKNR